MEWNSPNHPFLIWASTFLWLISIFSILWSLLLLFCVNDLLFLTGMDLVNAVVLLSGLIMLPTNIFILNHIAKGKKLDLRLRVFCCPLWQCILWIIIISFIGVVLCIHRLYICQDLVTRFFANSMKKYRSHPKYKRFIDFLQVYLQCCGLHSYTDWFKHDWHDKVRDYDLELSQDNMSLKKETSDSVPLSCCKSGSCVSNFLEELGTNSINENGCGSTMYRLIIVSMNMHLLIFVAVILLEILILRYVAIYSSNGAQTKLIDNIMPVNEQFDVSSDSYNLHEHSENGNQYEKST
ncbi:peripherin-2-like [Pieris brassicae]|uniref:peripherin-2-like n=1 Tax=Pieris brassicae TaxID=7116 RepID=UPI001E662611|nr:peripherin-2-like [Pieris brassicae]